MKKVGSYGGSNSSLTGNGAGFIKKKRFQIEDGSNLYRILPPFASLAETGAIAKYHEIYWLKNSAGKSLPVLSIQRMNRDKVILQRDPIADAVAQKKDELKILKDGGAEKALIDAVEKEVNALSLDKAFYVNAMNPAGEIGTLKIKITAWNSLKEMLKKLEQENIDPINVGKGNGIIFDFKKLKDDQGKTVYRVDIATLTKKDPNTGRAISEYQYLELDDSVFTRMEKEATDLTEVYKPFSMEEQTLLASFDPKTVDRVFQRPTKNEEVAGESEAADNVDTEDTGFKAATKTATSNAAPANPPKSEEASAAPAKSNPPSAEQPAQTTSGSTNDKVKAFLESRRNQTAQ